MISDNYTVSTDYLRPNRTIETIHFSEKNATFIMYNYQGVHFRLFATKIQLNNFLSQKPYKLLLETCSESEMDAFLFS